MSTTYGFSLRRRPRTSGGGGGGGATYAWARENAQRNTPWTAGALTINLAQTPADPDAIVVYSQTTPIQPGDYTYLTGPPRIRIDFPGDPANDYPDTGVWNFWIQYPYEV